ncbi:CDP-diacylglycerol diphosphatase [Methylocapsa palsarum]|uniref:CDP-diacylglycerol pyrophosphatase n=1 Tax=Methylocapsa palsarum TaxID=1612308 RepID=A0A1I3WTI9_9HYPH|nr:CDP-diacylglycerol diphosphatase [Methylocapsa palsarum]SFK10802.1 CDP-diacylglycerol pyrophosphatase [Methylocapsa palsarum]
MPNLNIAASRPALAARGRWRILRAAAAIVFAAIAVEGIGYAGDRDALWTMVHDLCVRDKKATGLAFPCSEVDLSGGEDAGFAIFRDIRSRSHLLLIPTRRLSGVEDPLVGTGGLPNYWADAWNARTRIALDGGKDLPRETFGMAINSSVTRSQDQLHIHVDCVRPDVSDKLSRHARAITAQWSVLPVRLAGQVYKARRLDGEELKQDPFDLVREDARASSTPMGEVTIGVIGARFRDGKEGFVLLVGRAGRGALAHAEDMLDHRCALAK